MCLKKGALADVGCAETPLLLEMAHDCRNKLVIATKLDAPHFESNVVVPVAASNARNIISSTKFILTPEHINKCYESLSNLQQLGNDSKEWCINNINMLNNDKLKNTMHARSHDRMSSFPGLNTSDWHWQFMMQNLSPIVVVLQMLNMCVSDEMLHAINWHDALFSNECHRDHEAHKV